ncbi:MAG: CBS domain-containing protein [Pseudomonadota bacterium]
MTTQLKDFATAVVAVVEPDTSALVVAQLMRKHHVGAMVVVDAEEKNRAVGIVSDRDLVLGLIAEELDPKIFTAGDMMSEHLVTASPEMDALDAIRLMNENKVRRLIIADQENRLVGIVTMEDLLQVLANGLTDLASGLAGAREREIQQRV